MLTNSRDKIQQIDLIWVDGKQPVLAFEIEHSTAITTGIDRFIELLKVARLAGRVVLVAPKSRQKKLNQVLSQSHYIGAPMYMESKVRYLWYLQVITIVAKFTAQQPTKGELLEIINLALHQPEVSTR